MIQPLDYHILIEPENNEDLVSKHGLLYKNQRKNQRVGKVLAIGDKVKNIKTGETVLFISNNCVEIDGLMIVNSDYKYDRVLANYENLIKAIEKFNEKH